MADTSWPKDGGCRCGKVRFRVAAPTLLTMACHCTGCRRMSASAFSLSAAIPSAAFEVTQGEPALGGLRGEVEHHFCPSCMSWLFTRAEAMPHFVNLRATMLDDAAWYVPFIETWTKEKLPWATTPAVHSFEEFPPFEAYEGLTRDYAAWEASRAG